MIENKNRQTYIDLVKLRGDGSVLPRAFISSVIWEKHLDFFESLKTQYPGVSIEAMNKNPQRENENIWIDKWNCKWHYPGDYLDGVVIEHPLKSWENYKTYDFPDPDKYRDWSKVKEDVKQAKQEKRIAQGAVEHGFLFLKMTYLRGFEEFMIDLAEQRPELYELRDRLVDYWIKVVENYVSCGVDEISFGDDLGLQKSLPMSPIQWREFLKPAFAKIFKVCKENHVLIYLHTDGYVVDIIPDLIDVGVDILNVQDFVNGLENLAEKAKGKVCIDLDIDRTNLTPFGTPQEIDKHIKQCITTLGTTDGGLILKYAAYPPTPIENIEQVISSMEQYHKMWT